MEEDTHTIMIWRRCLGGKRMENGKEGRNEGAGEGGNLKNNKKKLRSSR